MNEALRAEVIEQSKSILSTKMQTAETAMKAAQEAANNEEKSSMGDKYETGRAMNQLDRDMNARQLVGMRKEWDQLLKAIAVQATQQVQLGSWVQTQQGWFWLAAALGTLHVKDTKVMVVSPDAPVSKLMWGKKIKDTFMLNGKSFDILAIL